MRHAHGSLIIAMMVTLVLVASIIGAAHMRMSLELLAAQGYAHAATVQHKLMARACQLSALVRAGRSVSSLEREQGVQVTWVNGVAIVSVSLPAKPHRLKVCCDQQGRATHGTFV